MKTCETCPHDSAGYCLVYEQLSGIAAANCEHMRGDTMTFEERKEDVLQKLDCLMDELLLLGVRVREVIKNLPDCKTVDDVYERFNGDLDDFLLEALEFIDFQ